MDLYKATERVFAWGMRTGWVCGVSSMEDIEKNLWDGSLENWRTNWIPG